MAEPYEALAWALKQALAEQDAATAVWHEVEPPLESFGTAVAEVDAGAGGETLLAALRPLVLRQHLMNFRLWHKEDEARQEDVADAVIVACKRFIDAHNQKRNDFMEAVDAFVTARVTAAGSRAKRHNSESVGMIVDRLSILSLKIYHMREQGCREDVDEAHRSACAAKHAVLCEQRADLEKALFELLGEFAAGIKSPKMYRQFKMYNDPALNPRLYAKKAGK